MSLLALIIVSLAQITPFPTRLALRVPNSILRSCRLSGFASFSVTLVTDFNNSPDSSRYLILFITSSISLFDIINVLVPEPEVPDPRIFLWIPASATDAAASNPSGISKLLANGWITFSWTVNQLSIMVQKVYQRIPRIVLFLTVIFWGILCWHKYIGITRFQHRSFKFNFTINIVISTHTSSFTLTQLFVLNLLVDQFCCQADLWFFDTLFSLYIIVIIIWAN